MGASFQGERPETRLLTAMSANQTSNPGALRLLGTAVVWDDHGCMPLRTDDTFLAQLDRHRKSGFNVVSLNVGMVEISLLDRLRTLSFMR